MKKLYATICLSSLIFYLFSQDTFSIVAVDSTNGWVGSAGASCLQAPNPPTGCLIISDVIPGKGAIHTQAQWNSYNQTNAHGYMLQGLMPADILYHVNLDDYNGDSTIRQYGIALFDSAGHPRSGGYTGMNCFDYKNHIEGGYYSVQGNILLGQQILDSIEARFLHTPGDLADKLMAALQGANVAGADTRCMTEGIPAQSSFVRVAKPADSTSNMYLNLVVISRPYGMSPVDSLQTLFDAWRTAHPSGIQQVKEGEMRIYPNPASSVCSLQFAVNKERNIKVFDMLGKQIYEAKCFAYCQLPIANWSKGIYFIREEDSVYKLAVQ